MGRGSEEDSFVTTVPGGIREAHNRADFPRWQQENPLQDGAGTHGAARVIPGHHLV